MGFFNLFAKGDPGPDINEVSAWLKGPAVLLDVRDPQEYAAGHLPGSINLPVSELSRIRELARLHGGDHITATTLASAEEQLTACEGFKAEKCRKTALDRQ